MWVIELRLGKSMGRIKETLVRWMETFYLIYQLSKRRNQVTYGGVESGDQDVMTIYSIYQRSNGPLKIRSSGPFKWGGKERAREKIVNPIFVFLFFLISSSPSFSLSSPSHSFSSFFFPFLFLNLLHVVD